ncbi:AI-2E family transporter [Thiotrichales bacterium 19S9-12]|nr:AI-2E family transporter [Thiotrichales bacterium 19S9-11]MCF6812376.1 AI-2E family transporter [Thiotrichales bacterium 19S9-12]
MTSSRFLTIATGVIIVVAALWMISPFWLAFAWAAIIAIGVWPLYKRWYSLLNKHHAFASVTFTVLIGFIILLPIIWFGSLATNEIITLINYLKSANANQTPAPEWLVTIPFIGKYVVLGWNEYILTGHSLTDFITKFDLPFSQAGVIIGTLVRDFIIFFFTLVCLFFMLKDAPLLVQKIEQLGENRVSLWHSFLERTPKVIRSVIDSFVIIGAITGIIMGILYYFLGVQIPVVLGVLTALVTVIPYALIILLAAISVILAAQGLIASAVTVFVVGIAINLITDHWVRPVLIGRTVRMHFLATLFGALGGLEVLGFIGLFIGPVIFSLAILVWDEILMSRSREYF